MSISSAEEEDNIGDLYEKEITFQEESDLDLQLGDSVYTAEDQADIQALETIGSNFESPAAEEQGDRLWRFYPGGIRTSENFLRTVIKIKDSSTLSHIDIAESRKSGQVYNLLDKIKKSISSREVPSYSIKRAKQSIKEAKRELERTIENMETADFFGKTQDIEEEDQQGARAALERERTPPALSDERERSRSDLESSDEEEGRGKEIKDDENTDVTPFLSSLNTEPVDPLFIDSLRDMNHKINQEVMSSITEDPALPFLPAPDLKKFQTSSKEPLCRPMLNAPTFKKREDDMDESSIDSIENISVQNSSTGAIPKAKNSKKKDKRDKNQNLQSSDQLLILDSWETHRNDQTWSDPVLELTFDQICEKVDTKILLFKILSHQQKIPELSNQVANLNNAIILLQSDLNDIQTRIGRLEETVPTRPAIFDTITQNLVDIEERLRITQDKLIRTVGVATGKKTQAPGPCETRVSDKATKEASIPKKLPESSASKDVEKMSLLEKLAFLKKGGKIVSHQESKKPEKATTNIKSVNIQKKEVTFTKQSAQPSLEDISIPPGPSSKSALVLQKEPLNKSSCSETSIDHTDPSRLELEKYGLDYNILITLKSKLNKGEKAYLDDVLKYILVMRDNKCPWSQTNQTWRKMATDLIKEGHEGFRTIRNISNYEMALLILEFLTG